MLSTIPVFNIDIEKTLKQYFLTVWICLRLQESNGFEFSHRGSRNKYKKWNIKRGSFEAYKNHSTMGF